MNVFVTLLGAAIVFPALRDIFQQLFRPGGSGSTLDKARRTEREATNGTWTS